jgi:1,4-dihydroxy-2-naphthoate octaprenyltransferase
MSVATATGGGSPEVKSVITCDLEGRIETFNKGASEIFGYGADEVVGKKRVSLFSPGLTVLEHVPAWLKAAVDHGVYEGKTVFVRKDGASFPAQIKITPTFKQGKQIGYCGVSVPLPQTELENARPKISPFTRIFAALVVTRAPFLTATVVPVLIGAAWAAGQLGTGAFPWMLFVLSLIGACALHVSANTFNDYFDWTSGTDQNNNDYFLPFSGGSRSIELGLISVAGLYRLAWISLGVATACGVAIIAATGPWVLLFGVLGAFAAYFYTAPPLRLAARRGLGELWVGLSFGPLMTAGTATALTGTLSWESFWVGLPVGLLTTAILYINEFPDAESDARTGKNHLVVTFGKARARWGYIALLLGAAGSLGALVSSGVVPGLGLLALLSAPLGLHASRVLFQKFEARELIAGNRSTILLQLVFGLLMVAGMTIKL